MTGIVPKRCARPANLQICLDEPNKLFAPGDGITGTIHGVDLSRNGSIEITLGGSSKSYRRANNSRYEDRAPLIYQLTNIDISKAHPIHGLRFEITVPAKVRGGFTKILSPIAGDGYWTFDWQRFPGFEREAGHALPPTMAALFHQSSSRPLSAEGLVGYMITAVQVDGDVHTGEKVIRKSEESVHLTTSRISQAQFQKYQDLPPISVTQLLSIPSRQFSPGSDGKQPLTSRMKDAFTHTPIIEFQPVFTMPKVAAVGMETWLSIDLDALPPRTARDNFYLPPITLKSVDIHLMSSTGVRCKGIYKDMVEYFPSEAASVQKTPSHDFLPSKGGQQYEEYPFRINFKIPSTCTPTFKTYNLNMSWYVKAEACFQCLDREVTTDFKCGIVLISAPRI